MMCTDPGELIGRGEPGSGDVIGAGAGPSNRTTRGGVSVSGRATRSGRSVRAGGRCSSGSSLGVRVLWEAGGGGGVANVH